MACPVIDEAPACVGVVFRRGYTWPPGPIIAHDTDLTGATVVWEFLDKSTGAQLLVFSAASNNLTVTQIGADAHILPALSAAQTAALTFTKAMHKMSVTFADGSVDPYLEGEVVVK